MKFVREKVKKDDIDVRNQKSRPHAMNTDPEYAIRSGWGFLRWRAANQKVS